RRSADLLGSLLPRRGAEHRRPHLSRRRGALHGHHGTLRRPGRHPAARRRRDPDRPRGQGRVGRRGPRRRARGRRLRLSPLSRLQAIERAPRAPHRRAALRRRGLAPPPPALREVHPAAASRGRAGSERLREGRCLRLPHSVDSAHSIRVVAAKTPVMYHPTMRRNSFFLGCLPLVLACGHDCDDMGCIEGVTLELATPLTAEGEYTFTVTTESTTTTCVAHIPLRRDGTEPP